MIKEKKKVAIIDDEVDFCALVKLQCDKNSIPCRSANTINEGLDLVKDFEPDVVILDNNLPDGSGWAYAAGLLSQHPHVVLHLVTAHELFTSNKNNLSGRLFVHHKPLAFSKLREILA